MTSFAIADAFVERTRAVDGPDDLFEALEWFCAQAGLRYFALLHHVDFRQAPGAAVRLHNYPTDFQSWFDDHSLGRSDPIHRASHAISIGFPWSTVSTLIKLTPADHAVLDTARRFGIGDGFTVPANIPGEVHASCSFATASGEIFPPGFNHIAQLVGGFAFEAARRLSRSKASRSFDLPTLTDRQRECVLWAARGKTDWEIAVILGVSHETVIQHLKQARERYGVSKRAMLAVRALFDGLISFSDVFKR